MQLWFSVLPDKLGGRATPAITALNYEPTHSEVDFSICLLASILCEKSIIFSGCCPRVKGPFSAIFQLEAFQIAGRL